MEEIATLLARHAGQAFLYGLFGGFVLSTVMGRDYRSSIFFGVVGALLLLAGAFLTGGVRVSGLDLMAVAIFAAAWGALFGALKRLIRGVPKGV